MDQEKKAIYNGTEKFFEEKYGLDGVEVCGLLVGARGAIPKQLQNFCTRFRIHKDVLKNIWLTVVKNSIQIYRNHLYGS